MHLRHEHRRRRREIVGIDDLEKRLREPRELGVELQLHARGEKRGAFEQPLHVRIRNLEPAHAEARGNLGECLRKLGTHFAEMSQLPLVILEEPRIHYDTRVGARSATSTWPVSRSISVRTSSSRGRGSAQR